MSRVYLRSVHYLLAPTFLSAFLFAVSPTAAQDPEAPQTESEESAEDASTQPELAQRVSVNAEAPDEAIQNRLANIMDATGWFDDAEIRVEDSIAFLTGNTTTDERKAWAGRLAQNTEGVVAVVNRLEVKKSVNFSQAAQVVLASVKDLWDDFLTRSPLIIAGVLALVLTAIVSRIAAALAKSLASRSRLRTSLQDLILQLLGIAIWVAGLLVAAVIVFPGMTPAKALTVLGLGSVAIGFAFKDIFENFFAGILILWKYPFDRGDFVECGEIMGRIEEITIRVTMIRQVDGQLAVVPNSLLFKNPVDVLTDRGERRITVACGVAYDTDLARARDVIASAAKGCSSVRDNRPVEVFAQEFADSSINFEVTWWTGATPLDIRQSRDEVVQAVKRELDGAGIEIPFPQRTLWSPEPIRVFSDDAPRDNDDPRTKAEPADGG